MITTEDLDRLASWMERDGLTFLEVCDGNTRIRMTTAGRPASVAAPHTEVQVRSAAIGRFLPAHPRADRPIVVVGDPVEAGAIVGYLQNDGVLLPIISPYSGQVAVVHPESGTLLGYGSPVLTLLGRSAV